jgi:hypothetical protein
MVANLAITPGAGAQNSSTHPMRPPVPLGAICSEDGHA